jgi:hypothetical protein
MVLQVPNIFRQYLGAHLEGQAPWDDVRHMGGVPVLYGVAQAPYKDVAALQGLLTAVYRAFQRGGNLFAQAQGLFGIDSEVRVTGTNASSAAGVSSAPVAAVDGVLDVALDSDVDEEGAGAPARASAGIMSRMMQGAGRLVEHLGREPRLARDGRRRARAGRLVCAPAAAVVPARGEVVAGFVG